MLPRNIKDLPWRPQGRVLDPFAGERKWWAGCGHMSAVTFTDQAPSDPAIIEADAAHLPFADGSFDEIWADPPHLIRNDVKHWTKGYARFGHYTNRAQLESLWPAWSAEFRRVCNGVLVLKTVDGGDRRVIKRTDLAMFEPQWEMVDVVEAKTSPPWSTTTTLYTRWLAKE